MRWPTNSPQLGKIRVCVGAVDTGTILGIDAAWTSTGSSGIAVVQGSNKTWRLIAVSDSYADLCGSAGSPTITDVVLAAETLAGSSVNLIAIDMPMSHSPIKGRRQSDNAVSAAYGARKCGTHSPSATRPGLISDEICLGLRDLGYLLQTEEVCVPGLIEVYPHPALVELTCSDERLPYKIAKIASYWSHSSREERRA